MSPDAWIAHITHDPGTTVSRNVLPDGTVRVIIDDANAKTHAVIDDHGYAGKHIVVTEPTSRAHKEKMNVSVGSIHVSESRQGDVTTTVIDTNGAVPMLYYMVLADFMALIVATVLAAPLAREADGHIEVALTKPCSRVRYALGAIGADVTGIVSASVMTVIAFYICQLLFESGRLDFSGINMNAIAIGIAMPLATYALLVALTTWMNRAYIAVLVAFWPICALVGLLTLLHPVNSLALFIHDVAWWISRLHPLSYVEFATPNSDGTFAYTSANFGLRLSIEVLMFLVYGAFAIWQWKRVEA
jgi:hypothetical protein